MTNDEKLMLLESLSRGGARIGNLFFDNHAAMTIHNHMGEDMRRSGGYTDKQVAAALLNIIGKNKAIDSKQKWAGAHWYLRWVCNYPAKAQDFCTRINQLPFDEEPEIKCEYNNIRALSTLSFMNEDPEHLETVKYSKNDEPAFFQMREVVVALERELSKTDVSQVMI